MHLSGEIHISISIDSHLPHFVYLTIVLNGSLVLSVCVSVLACLVAWPFGLFC